MDQSPEPRNQQPQHPFPIDNPMLRQEPPDRTRPAPVPRLPRSTDPVASRPPRKIMAARAWRWADVWSQRTSVQCSSKIRSASSQISISSRRNEGLPAPQVAEQVAKATVGSPPQHRGVGDLLAAAGGVVEGSSPAQHGEGAREGAEFLLEAVEGPGLREVHALAPIEVESGIDGAGAAAAEEPLELEPRMLRKHALEIAQDARGLRNP